jgi:hypothetical protein
MKKISFTLLLLIFCCFFFNGLWGQTPMVKTVWFHHPAENAKAFINIVNDERTFFYNSEESNVKSPKKKD